MCAYPANDIELELKKQLIEKEALETEKSHQAST